MNLVSQTTPEEKRERLVRLLYDRAGSKKPEDALAALRKMLEDHFGPAGSVESERS